jgi:hypothetical protein
METMFSKLGFILKEGIAVKAIVRIVLIKIIDFKKKYTLQNTLLNKK